MSRPENHDSNPACHDSLLDVVTNIVGILIILVVVAGLRAQNAPVQAALLGHVPASPALAELQQDQAVEQSLRQDVYRIAEQIRNIEQESLQRFLERDGLATAVSGWEHRIASRRDQLDAQARADFDLQRALAEAQLQLDQLRSERVQAESSRPKPILVESYPTPLSKTVDSDEAQFQLRAGRLAYIPLDRLLERFKADVRRQMYKLLELPELTDTVGPEGGFRLRYTMERRDVSVDTQLRTGQGAYVQLRQYTLIPTSSELGEPIQTALAEGSELRQRLAGLRPGKTTITVWVYTDSFAAFRQLRKDLYERGFAVAGRPLPEGVPIGGSPAGTKSAAE